MKYLLLLGISLIPANAQLISQGLPVSLKPIPMEAAEIIFSPINPTKIDPFELGILGAAGSTFDVHLLVKIDNHLAWTPSLGNRTRLTLDSNDGRLLIRFMQEDDAQMLQGVSLVPEGATWLPEVTQGFWETSSHTPAYAGREVQAWNSGIHRGAGQIGWLKPGTPAIPEPDVVALVLMASSVLILARRRRA